LNDKLAEKAMQSSERRSFLTALKSALASLGSAGLAAAATSKAKPPARFEPARHEQDDWFDAIPGKHRVVFDTTTADAFGEALAFAGNYVRTNKNDYGLEQSDLAIIIIARHRATPFAYSDAIWAKYGDAIAKQSLFEDPKTKSAPHINVFNSSEYGRLLPNRGATIESALKMGIHFAVCSSATRAYSGSIATAAGSTAAEINRELIANLVSTTARMVPAGIVAVNRAQERGYTLVKT
jgi:intracellular sulfur oxidation DsrE/DsrF family protein